MTDDWRIVAKALKRYSPPCQSCGGRGYHASNTDYPDRDCRACCGTGHELEENDL